MIDDDEDEMQSQKHIDPEKQTPKDESRVSKKDARPVTKKEFDFDNSSKHTPPAIVEEYMAGKGSLWMKPSYLGNSEYQPQVGFGQNNKGESILEYDN